MAAICARRTGKREQADQYLTTAATMYREMGMTYWLKVVKGPDGGERFSPEYVRMIDSRRTKM